MYFLFYSLLIRGSRVDKIQVEIINLNSFIRKHTKIFFCKITDTKYRNRYCDINFIHFVLCTEIIKKYSVPKLTMYRYRFIYLRRFF